jgi:hypothetical protein
MYVYEEIRENKVKRLNKQKNNRLWGLGDAKFLSDIRGFYTITQQR